MDFKDNVVILTGASTGIGEAMAYELAGQGAWLALAARNTVRLEDCLLYTSFRRLTRTAVSPGERNPCPS